MSTNLLSLFLSFMLTRFRFIWFFDLVKDGNEVLNAIDEATIRSNMKCRIFKAFMCRMGKVDNSNVDKIFFDVYVDRFYRLLSGDRCPIICDEKRAGVKPKSSI